MTGRPRLVAGIGGFSAWAITPTLTRELPRLLERLAGADPRVRAELVETAAAVRQAGEQWAAWRASADGNSEGLAAEATPPSSPWLTTGQAADALGVSARRVRQLAAAGDLPAQRAGGRWLVEADAVRLRRAAVA